MEPNKFEKYIKKQLQQREIQPSSEAWEHLTKKLDETEPPAKRRSYFWYGMAASFVGLLLISAIFFGLRNPGSALEGEVVNTTDETIETNSNPLVFEEKEIEDAVVEHEKIEQPPIVQEEMVVKKQMSELGNQITSVEEVDDLSVSRKTESDITSNTFKEEVIDTKILEIVAAVDSLERNSDALTEAEVDALLRNAQEEILRGRLFNKNGSVDAMALLTEVEDELDQSFRDQIFESLKAGFLKVRTAVADRNR